MDIILAGETALQYWRQNRSDRPLPNASMIKGGHGPSLAKVEAELLADAYQLSLPLCIYAHEESQTRRDAFSTTVRCSAGNAPAIIRLHEGLAVSTPEFALLQVAHRSSPVRLLYDCYELCGDFKRNEFSGSGFITVAPLMTPESLEAFLRSIPTITSVNDRPQCVRGANNLSRLLPFLAANAHSPMEIETAMRFVLPYKLGGYKLPLMQLNPELKLTSAQQRILGRPTLKPDLYWPQQRVIAEYESALHMNPEQHAYDALRNNAFTELGLQMILITSDHLSSVRKMDELAEQLARLLGKRIRPSISDHLVRKDRLARELYQIRQERSSL